MLLYQADVCDACQLLIKGGLKDENIIDFHIWWHCLQVIINSPIGEDVYKGVPKADAFRHRLVYN